MTSSLFESFLVVDWSAGATPKTGQDSVWWTLVRRDGADVRRVAESNPSTRLAARAELGQVIAEERRAGRRVLAGFDFPFGYPSGVAARLTDGGNWRDLWRLIAERIEEGPRNETNRLEVAAALNACWPGEGPFWGNGAKRDIPGLGRKKPIGYGASLPPEWRAAERAQRARKGAKPKSVWQLAGAGAVGSQVLTGLALLEALRRDPRFAEDIRVWPFETGLQPPGEGGVCLAEVYPSLTLTPDDPTLVKDQAQTRATAQRFAALDAVGALGPLFAPAAPPPDAEVAAAATEEAWILGLGHETALQGAAEAELTERRRAPSPPPPTLSATGRPSLTLVRAPSRPPLRYERDPAAIYAASFAAVRREARLDRLPGGLAEVATRLIHACGMVEIADRLAFSADCVGRATTALASGAPVLCDCEMVAAGVIRRALPRENAVVVTLNDPRTPAIAERIGNTRSAAAVELWGERLDGAVVAVGNAPTALFHLLELIDQGAPKPAVILGFSVGFIGAAESKAELARDPRGAAFLTLRGRRGGSAMASAAVNALAALAMARRGTGEHR